MTNGSVTIRKLLIAGVVINAVSLFYMIFELTGCNSMSITSFRIWSIGNLLILATNFAFIGYSTYFLTSNTGLVCGGYYLPESSKHTTQSFYTVLESHLLMIFMAVWIFYFFCSLICIRYSYNRVDRRKQYADLEEQELVGNRG